MGKGGVGNCGYECSVNRGDGDRLFALKAITSCFQRHRKGLPYKPTLDECFHAVDEEITNVLTCTTPVSD